MRAFSSKIILLFLITSQAYSQAPAIAWADISAGTFGSSFKSVRSGPNFFVFENAATSGSRTLKVKRVTIAGVASSQLVYEDNCSTCGTNALFPTEILPTTDDGALLYYQTSSSQFGIQKVGSNGSVAWFRALNNFEFVKVATGTNNTILLVMKATSGIDSGKYFLWYIAGSTGLDTWRLNLGSIAPTDITVTPDGGVITTATDSTKSYANTGVKRWARRISSRKIKVIDTNEAYLLDANILYKINLTTGNSVWALNEPNLNDVLVTSDKGAVIGTASRTLKITNAGTGAWSNTRASQKLQLADDGTIGSVGVGPLANTATVLNTTGTTLWQKQFTYNLNNTLSLLPASDNGWYATTHGQVPGKLNQSGTAFLYRILPVSTPCVYTATITPNAAQVICQTGTATLQVAQTSLDLSFGLPTSDFTITWLKGPQSVATNTLSYTIDTEGDFSARIQQGTCPNVSPSVNVSVLGKQTPVATNDLIEQCLNGGSVSKLTVTGCTNATALWSNGQTGTTISVTPTVTTSYTAACVESYTQAGVPRTCQSKNSSAVSVRVLTQSDMQIVGIDGPSVLCDGKTDTLKTFLGGVFYVPIQLEWSRNETAIPSNLNGLAQLVSESGGYQLKAKDRRGCTAQTDVKIVAKSALTVSIDGNRDFCQGVSGSLTAQATGGIGNLQYDWRLNNTSLSSINKVDILSSGNYNLTVTDSRGCQKAVSAQVTVNPNLTGAYKNRSTVKGNLTYEFNENTLIGGTKPYVIVLNARSASNQAVPITNTTVGKFTENSKISVFVTDAKGCTLRDSILIDYVPCNVGVSVTGDALFCYYDNATLNATPVNGVRPLAYAWQKDNNALTATTIALKTNATGNYKATVTDSAQCVATSSEFKVTEKGRDINAAITASGSLSVFWPAAVSLTANNGTGFKHQWYRNDSLLTDQTAATIEAQVSGNYSVRIEKEGCSDTSNVLAVSILIPLGTENNWFEGNVSAFPNPTDTYLIINAKTSQPTSATCQIYDARGKLIYEEKDTQKLSEHQFKIETLRWAGGTYHYRIQTTEGTATGKLVKR